MHPEIRAITSPAVDLADVHPSHEVFSFLVRFVIGPAGQPGEESFDIIICSPGWLEQEVARNGGRSGEGLYICNPDQAKGAIDALTRRILNTNGSDWDELAGRLSHFLVWEFQDYPD